MIITLVLVRIAKIIATPISQILHFVKKIVKSDFSRGENFWREFAGRRKARWKIFFTAEARRHGENKIELAKFERRIIDRADPFALFQGRSR